jgi:hypothetical protein
MTVPEGFLALTQIEGPDGQDLPMTPELRAEVIAFVEAFRAERDGVLPALHHLLDGDPDGRVLKFPWNYDGRSVRHSALGQGAEP